MVKLKGELLWVQRSHGRKHHFLPRAKTRVLLSETHCNFCNRGSKAIKWTTRAYRKFEKKFGVPSVGLRDIRGSIVLYLRSTWLVGNLTPCHRREVLGAKFEKQMVIDHKSATYYRNMYTLQRTYFVLFVSLWGTMKTIAKLMNLWWKEIKMCMRCRVINKTM